MAPAAKPRVWEVVGGVDRGGIVVREGEDLASPVAAGRLATGALVLELQLLGERLQFRRLTGLGPEEGWVSVRLPNGKEMLAAASDIWEVVGGGDKGGIVARAGKDVASELLQSRVSTGALLRCLALSEERLQFQRLTGSGPDRGWVSVKLKDSDRLLVAPLEAGGKAPVAAAVPAAAGQRGAAGLRICCLHASPGNGNVLRFQLAALKKALGPEAEWSFLDAPLPWRARPGSPWPNDQERSESEMRLAQGKAFTQWYAVTSPAGDVWEGVEECCRHLSDQLLRLGSVDVVVGFSHGASALSLLQQSLQRQGKPPPWRLAIFFSGGSIDDRRFHFQQPAQSPTILVSGKADPFGGHIAGSVRAMYPAVRVLEHPDGHLIPAGGPLYEELAAAVRSACSGGGERSLATEPEGKWTVDYLGQARGACKASGCPWYQWSPESLPATVEALSIKYLYDLLRCKACGRDFLEHKCLGFVDKPAGYYPGISEKDLELLS